MKARSSPGPNAFSDTGAVHSHRLISALCLQARHAKAAAIVRIHSSPHVTREGLQGMGKSLVAMLAAHGASQAIKQLDVSGAVTRACSNVAKQQGSRVYL